MTDAFNSFCYHHPHREAVVRCPGCQRFFCRECVTEHEDRMLCSNCLAQISGKTMHADRCWRQQLFVGMQGLSAFLFLWYLFFLLGQMLLAIPHSFHEGTIWQSEWWRKP
jgi:hypothetical protein